MKNNRIRLTSYISPDLDMLIQEYMYENNISTKSQALERMLIEFKYMKNEINFLRNIVGGGNTSYTQNLNYTPSNSLLKERDKVKDSISDIYTNMPD